MATQQRERRERQPSPLEVFAASRISGGRGGGGEGPDPFALAMKLLDMQKDRSSDVEDREYKDRVAAAEEMWRQGQLEQGTAQERRLMETLAESKRADAEREATRQRERGEDIAHRTEQERLTREEKTATLAKSEKDEAVDAIDKMRTLGVITPEEARARYDKLDPEMAELAKGMKAQKDEAAFKKGIEDYQRLSPKDRTRALPESFGGPEVFQRVKDAIQGYTYEPGSPSAMPGKMVDWKPRLEPTVSEPQPQVGYGRAPQTVAPQAWGTMGTRTVPSVGGITEPVTAPAGLEPEPYPTLTTEDYQRAGIETPEATQARYDADPRYMTAEQELLKKAVDWWQGNNTEQIGPVPPEEFINAPPEFTYEEGYPSAMPPEMGVLDRLGLNARMNLGRQRAGGGPRMGAVDSIMSFLGQPREKIGD